MYEKNTTDDRPYVISVTRNEALFLDDSVTLMVESSPEFQNIRPLRPISPVTSGGVPAPMELIQKLGKAVLYTANLENRNKEYKLFLEEFELLILREVCHSLAKFGSELVGFSLKKKIYSALFQKDLEMEQQVNKLLWDIDKKMPKKDSPKFKVNIKNVDELLEHFNKELRLDEENK
tara:strand:+ start:1128 stop:1658 length:531 start_codon:yes stop_codon:yes gene_type:complete